MPDKPRTKKAAPLDKPLVEWAKWECPECGDICDDPESVLETSCHNGHSVVLAIVYPNDTSGWREAFKGVADAG